jgi:uncharacterized membrane protein YkoI
MTAAKTAGTLALGFIAGVAGAGATLWFANAREEGEEGEEQGEKTVVVSPSGDSAAAAALAAIAKISQDSAQVIALAQVPGGRIESGELENEDGKLIYSFDIKVAGKEGIEEVHVSAITGEVIKKVHESDAAEAAEKRKEAKAAKKPDGSD